MIRDRSRLFALNETSLFASSLLPALIIRFSSFPVNCLRSQFSKVFTRFLPPSLSLSFRFSSPGIYIYYLTYLTRRLLLANETAPRRSRFLPPMHFRSFYRLAYRGNTCLAFASENTRTILRNNFTSSYKRQIKTEAWTISSNDRSLLAAVFQIPES